MPDSPGGTPRENSRGRLWMSRRTGESSSTTATRGVAPLQAGRLASGLPSATAPSSTSGLERVLVEKRCRTFTRTVAWSEKRILSGVAAPIGIPRAMTKGPARPRAGFQGSFGSTPNRGAARTVTAAIAVSTAMMARCLLGIGVAAVLVSEMTCLRVGGSRPHCASGTARPTSGFRQDCSPRGPFAPPSLFCQSRRPCGCW